MKFPTIGRRSAGRFVFYLINLPKQEVDELIASLQELKNNISLCTFCFQPYENNGQTLCNVCGDSQRSKDILCVVEKEQDLLSLEATKKHKGRYFILGGTLTLRKSTPDHLRMKELQDRIAKNNFTEIIIALNPTPEGRTTSVLVERAIKEISQSKITHLATGLPIGGELEYADEETLESAFDGRN